MKSPFAPDPSPRPRHALERDEPYATYALILINLAVFVVSGFRGGVGDTSGEVLFDMGSLYSPAVWDGQWWRLLSSMFLHGGLIHIGFNMFVLYQIGPELERLYGTPRFLLVYFGAGWMGSLASLIWSGNSVGASGAIFGLAGAFLAMSLHNRNVYRAYGSQMLGFVAINLMIGFSGMFGIDNYGHMGGLLGGFILGNVVANRLPEFRPSAARLAATVAVLVAFVALTPVATRFSEQVLTARYGGQ